MSTTQNRVRKSSRQPVPNPIYQQGITQLKNQNTFRPKRKNKNQQQNISYEEERNSQIIYQQSYNNYSQSKEQYLPCKLPDGSQMKVMFIIQNKKEQKEKKKEKQTLTVSVPTPKPAPVVNNNKKSTSLLSLFIQAIDNVDIAEQPSQQINFIQKIAPIEIQKQKQPPIKQKRSKIQQQQFIKKVEIGKQNMIFLHSEFGQIEIPIDWEDNKIVQQQSAQVEEIRKKIVKFQEYQKYIDPYGLILNSNFVIIDNILLSNININFL